MLHPGEHPVDGADGSSKYQLISRAGPCPETLEKAGFSKTNQSVLHRPAHKPCLHHEVSDFKSALGGGFEAGEHRDRALREAL